MISRRSLLGFIAASPVIIKASSLMSVRSFVAPAPLWVDGVETDYGFVPFAPGAAIEDLYGAAMYQGWRHQQHLLAHRFARDKLLAAARAMNGESS